MTSPFKRKAIYIISICCIILIFLFSSCGCPTNTKQESNLKNFIPIERTPFYGIYYQKDTYVMYALSQGGSFTVMVNPDGTPQLYNK